MKGKQGKKGREKRVAFGARESRTTVRVALLFLAFLVPSRVSLTVLCLHFLL
jgi:hypothetical protein